MWWRVKSFKKGACWVKGWVIQEEGAVTPPPHPYELCQIIDRVLNTRQRLVSDPNVMSTVEFPSELKQVLYIRDVPRNHDIEQFPWVV